MRSASWRALDDLTRRLDTHLRFSERFPADATHDFRSPLASIRASAETLAYGRSSS